MWVKKPRLEIKPPAQRMSVRKQRSRAWGKENVAKGPKDGMRTKGGPGREAGMKRRRNEKQGELREHGTQKGMLR